MKKKLINILTIMTLTFAVLSCSTSDDSINEILPENITIEQIQDIAQNSTWRVTYFFDTDHEETNNFSGYSFSFNVDGTIAATNGSTTVNGTWSIDDGSSSSDDDHHFNINFTSPSDFEELSDDWEIISASTTKIELTDVSGGNGGTDFLTFEKM